MFPCEERFDLAFICTNTLVDQVVSVVMLAINIGASG